MRKNSKFNFGKHKNRTIEEVWKGKVAANEAQILKNYLQELFDFFGKKTDNKILIPATDFDCTELENECELLQNSTSPYNVIVTEKYIVIETNHTQLKEILNKIIVACLQSDYRQINQSNRLWVSSERPIGEECYFSSNSIEFLNIKAYPQYLKWCIDKVDNFFIVQADLDMLMTLSSRCLHTFKVKQIKDDIIEYTPVFHEYYYELSKETQDKNQEKYLAYNSSTKN